MLQETVALVVAVNNYYQRKWCKRDIIYFYISLDIGTQ